MSMDSIEMLNSKHEILNKHKCQNKNMRFLNMVNWEV
jgi:hypothetical protein